MTAGKSSSRRAKIAPPPLSDPGQNCLQQVEICLEQARDAARLKRFGAAFGLFTTAATLCRHVSGAEQTDELTRHLVCERLHQIDIEMATYAELARTTGKH